MLCAPGTGQNSVYNPSGHTKAPFPRVSTGNGASFGLRGSKGGMTVLAPFTPRRESFYAVPFPLGNAHGVAPPEGGTPPKGGVVGP